MASAATGSAASASWSHPYVDTTRCLEATIPDDMGVVSILAPQVAPFVAPQLTTIDLPALEMGRLGAEILIRRLTDRDAPPDQIMLRGTLQIRSGRNRPRPPA